LLKNPHKLDDVKNEAARLRVARELNAPLAAAYYLKEDLRQLWSQPHKEVARQFLEDWIARARAIGLRQLRQMADTLSLHRAGLLAYYDVPIPPDLSGGRTNKITTLQRQACGFRDPEFFRLRIYALHNRRYALVG
jgi:transposase